PRSSTAMARISSGAGSATHASARASAVSASVHRAAGVAGAEAAGASFASLAAAGSSCFGEPRPGAGGGGGVAGPGAPDRARSAGGRRVSRRFLCSKGRRYGSPNFLRGDPGSIRVWAYGGRCPGAGVLALGEAAPPPRRERRVGALLPVPRLLPLRDQHLPGG